VIGRSKDAVCRDSRADANPLKQAALTAHRYAAGRLLTAPNQPFRAWDSLFADEMMPVAAIDRLVHLSMAK